MFFKKSHTKRKRKQAAIKKVKPLIKFEKNKEIDKEPTQKYKKYITERKKNVLHTERKRNEVTKRNGNVVQLPKPRRYRDPFKREETILKSEICKARKQTRRLIFTITKGKGMKVKHANFNELSKVRCT